MYVQVAPVFSARTLCTFPLVSGLFRNLLLNNVGWRMFRPLWVPTLSGPSPVTVVRPCLSVYVVFHPALSAKVWSCMDWSCFWSHAASLLPFSTSVDEVVRTGGGLANDKIYNDKIPLMIRFFKVKIGYTTFAHGTLAEGVPCPRTTVLNSTD